MIPCVMGEKLMRDNPEIGECTTVEVHAKTGKFTNSLLRYA